MARIKLFAAFREKVGKREVRVKIEGRKSVAELLQTLKEEYPQLREVLERGNVLVAVNQQASDAATLVGDSDEIAIFPPVSGGSTNVRIQRRDFSIAREIKKVASKSKRIGGIVTFLGTARDFSRGKKVKKLVYEHYAGMAQKKLEELREEAMKKFDVIEISMVHRTGEIKAGENIVLIIAAAEHRSDAFKACQWCIDELKKVLPIWKKEHTTEGEVWVEEHA